MACNAWNHSADCSCGWGGDTGGGYRGITAQVRSVVLSDGFTWRFERRPKYESFVNPNARCPVCDADVYFYQSPFGGRVFFDELGPPWPKHHCTDAWQDGGGQGPIQPPLFAGSAVETQHQNPDEWRPLIPLRVDRGETEDRLFLDRVKTGLPGTFICLPAKTFGYAPAYWRRNPAVPTEVEVSIPIVDAARAISELRRSVPSWFCDDSDVEAFEAGRPLSADNLHSIGRSYSFHWEDHRDRNWTAHPAVNFPLARDLFERAAELGCTAAQNDLGIMYRDGLGLEANARQAFELFQSGAQNLNFVSLGKLAACYRDGIGVDANEEEAIFLGDLAQVVFQDLVSRLRSREGTVGSNTE